MFKAGPWIKYSGIVTIDPQAHRGHEMSTKMVRLRVMTIGPQAHCAHSKPMMGHLDQGDPGTETSKLVSTMDLPAHWAHVGIKQRVQTSGPRLIGQPIGHVLPGNYKDMS